MSILEVRGLSSGYGPQPVITDVDLVVEPGEVVDYGHWLSCRAAWTVPGAQSEIGRTTATHILSMHPKPTRVNPN